MSNPTIDLRCMRCGMPLAEGSLLTVPGGLACENCFDEVTDDSVCDFCGDGEAVWSYDAQPFGMVVMDSEGVEQDVSIINFDDVWYACDSCAILINADDAHGLVARILAFRGQPKNLPPELDFKEVLLTYFVVVLDAMKRPPKRRGTR
jgi:RNA polymerase subunit RPABC4/transcription elongation factor Spt4